MNLQEWMNTAKAENEQGKSLLQVALETYLTKQLGFQLLEVTPLNKKYEEAFRFVVTNGENEYVFENQYDEPHNFAPYQHVLTLKEIRGKEGFLTTDHMIWLTRDNKNDKFLSTPLAELLSGVQNDAELNYVVHYLKTAFENTEGYRYEEVESNDVNTFRVFLKDEVVIHKGFSNAIQCDFLNEEFSSVRLVFKDRNITELNAELDTLIAFVHTYLAKRVTVDGHELFALYHYLKQANLRPQVCTNALLPQKHTKLPLLVSPFVIDTGYFHSYHQVEAQIYYNHNTQSLVLESNYLLRKFTTECASVGEVINEIETLKTLVQTMSQHYA